MELLVAEAKRSPFARTEGLSVLEEQREYLKLAEFARSTLGPAGYAKILNEQVGHPVRPTAAHTLIASADYRGVITTNYDRLLDTTIALERGWFPNTFTPDAVSAVASARYADEFFLFKMHGHLCVDAESGRVLGYIKVLATMSSDTIICLCLKDRWASSMEEEET